MNYLKIGFLAISLIAILMPAQAMPRRHGPHAHVHSHGSSEDYDPVLPRERRQGRGGSHGHGHMHAGVEEEIPGFPMKGPPPPPFVPPGRGRGMQGPPPPPPFYPPVRGQGPPPRGNVPLAGNSFPINNFAPQQNTFPTNNFPTNPNPAIYPANSGPVAQDAYRNNPFLNPAQPSPAGPQGNFVQRPPQPAVQKPEFNQFVNNFSSRDGVPESPQLKPNQSFNFNNFPAIEPVTNDLPGSEGSKQAPTTKPTINPRTFDLLAGSNLFEEATTVAPLLVPAGKSLEPDFDIGTRVLLDSIPHCKSNEVLVDNKKCRPRV